MNAYDEIFGVNWRDQIRDDFRRRAQSARRVVEMYETGRDIALIQERDGRPRWVFVDELSEIEFDLVLDSTLPRAIDPEVAKVRGSSKFHPFSDHDYDEDYLP